jgi:hypothetical protein
VSRIKHGDIYGLNAQYKAKSPETAISRLFSDYVICYEISKKSNRSKHKYVKDSLRPLELHSMSATFIWFDDISRHRPYLIQQFLHELIHLPSEYKLTDSAQRVHFYLSSLIEENGTQKFLYPKKNTIALSTNLAEKSVYRALSELENAQLIVRHKQTINGEGRNQRYMIANISLGSIIYEIFEQFRLPAREINPIVSVNTTHPTTSLIVEDVSLVPSLSALASDNACQPSSYCQESHTMRSKTFINTINTPNQFTSDTLSVSLNKTKDLKKSNSADVDPFAIAHAAPSLTAAAVLQDTTSFLTNPA